MTTKSTTGARKATARAAKPKGELARAPEAKAPPAEPFGPAAGVKLLGEVVTWNVTGAVRYADLTAALKAAGLDESVARELAPRHAFTRACKKLSDDRIIRQVDDDGAKITFQFTKESKVGDQYEYALETMLALDKKSGKVTCELADLADRAQVALDECIAVRTAGDVTGCIQKLFERNADLFRIREQGGCYFVPDRFADFLERIDGFVRGINGVLRRFPVPAGTPQGTKSVRDAVADGLGDAITEHVKAVGEFGLDTRDATFERAAERIKETRFKVEMYAEYLGAEKARLEESLAAATVALKKRLTEIATAEPVYLAESAEAWGKGDTVELAVAEMRRNGEYPAGAEVPHKVWKVHPATTMNAGGRFVCPVGGADKPELVLDMDGPTTEEKPAEAKKADAPPATDGVPVLF